MIYDVPTADKMIYDLYAQYLRDKNAYNLKIGVLKIITNSHGLYNYYTKLYANGSLDKFLPVELQSTYKGLSGIFDTSVALWQDPELQKIALDLKNKRISESEAQVQVRALQSRIAKAIIVDKANKRGLKDLAFMPFDLMKSALAESSETVRQVIQTGGEVIEKGVDTVGEFLNNSTIMIGGVAIVLLILAYKAVTSDTGKTLASRI